MLCMRRSATPSALCQAISGHGSEGLPDVHAAGPPTRTHTTASDPRVRKAVECNLRCTFNKSAELYLVNQTSHVSSYTAQQPWQKRSLTVVLVDHRGWVLGRALEVEPRAIRPCTHTTRSTRTRRDVAGLAGSSMIIHVGSERTQLLRRGYRGRCSSLVDWGRRSRWADWRRNPTVESCWVGCHRAR